MNKRTRIRCVAIAFLSASLVGCAVVNIQRLRVASQTASEFFYLQTQIFNRLGNNEAAQRRAVENSRLYGPHGIGDPVPYSEGRQYIFVPRCGNRLAWEHRVSRTPSTSGPPIRVECR